MIWVLFRSKPLWSKRTDAKLLPLSVSIQGRQNQGPGGLFPHQILTRMKAKPFFFKSLGLLLVPKDFQGFLRPWILYLVAVALVSGWFVRTHLRSHETVVRHYENKLIFFPLKIWLLYTVLCQCPMVFLYLDQDSVFRSSVSLNQYLGKSKSMIDIRIIHRYLELISKTKNK